MSTILRVSCLLLIMLTTSCGNWDSEIVKNRKNLQNLRVGMTKDEVRQVMGPPIQGEKYCRPNVWFYYSDYRWSDFMITRDECTPLVFMNGQLSGWGQEYYKKHCLFATWDREKGY